MTSAAVTGGRAQESRERGRAQESRKRARAGINRDRGAIADVTAGGAQA